MGTSRLGRPAPSLLVVSFDRLDRHELTVLAGMVWPVLNAPVMRVTTSPIMGAWDDFGASRGCFEGSHAIAQ